jgi:hypothetical protein
MNTEQLPEDKVCGYTCGCTSPEQCQFPINKQLPEDIQKEIDHLCSNNYFIRASLIKGYHLRDEQVEGLKKLINCLEGKHSSANSLIQQQSVTISELLQGLEALKNMIDEIRNPNTHEFAEQLLQKHKP